MYLKKIVIPTLNNFPFIEADYDAVTYYELICEVASTVNNYSDIINSTIKNMEQLNTKVSELTTKVNEINNIIDDFQTHIEEKFNQLAEELRTQEREDIIRLERLINSEVTILTNKFDSFKEEVLLLVNSANRYTDTQIHTLDIRLTNRINGLEELINSLDISNKCYNPLHGEETTIEQAIKDIWQNMKKDTSYDGSGNIIYKQGGVKALDISTYNKTINDIEEYQPTIYQMTFEGGETFKQM